jgi:hypothetical protein
MNTLNDTKSSILEAIKIVDSWREKYHTDTKGNIIFQNKEQLTNIFFNNQSFHVISKNTRGFENLPETVIHPDEIWARWGDSKQLIVLRNYLKFGENINYCVQTRDGIIINAFAVVDSLVDRYRKGLILLR